MEEMTEDKVWYRVYRPSCLNEIVGQDHVVLTLKQASAKKKFSHSYILVGERGCGKTSTARILANLMTCENPEKGKVCGKCRACTTVPYDMSIDVKEINGAGQGNVENINALIEAAKWPPHELKKKVFIIDECHRLSGAAESNLLKITEEPPPYLVFIFCTTDVDKVLPTILSRCQRFNFGKIKLKNIVTRLKYIAEQEKVDIEDNAVVALAKMARGSLRDGVNALQQIATAASDKKISEAAVIKYFGLVDRLAVLNMVRAMLDSNVPLVMDQVNDLVMASVDCQDILYELSEVLRNVMILKAQKDIKLVDLPDNEIEDLVKLSQSFRIEQLIKLSHLFSEIGKKLEFSINERWIMEATLINCIGVLRK